MSIRHYHWPGNCDYTGKRYYFVWVAKDDAAVLFKRRGYLVSLTNVPLFYATYICDKDASVIKYLLRSEPDD